MITYDRKVNHMRFRIEDMKTEAELASEFPMGTVHEVDYYDSYKHETYKRKGKVVGYTSAIPTTSFISLPGVVFEDVDSDEE